MEHLVEGPRGAPVGHAGVDLLACRDPTVEGPQVHPVAEADELHDPGGDGLGRGGHGHPVAVAALPGPSGHGVGDPRPETGLEVPRGHVGGRQRAHALEERLEQVDVDDLPDAGPQRDHRGERADQGGHLVGQRDGRQERPAVGLAVQRREPGHGLGDRGEPGPARVRSVLPEARDAQDDELGVAGEEDVGREAEPLERARPEVLDQDVRALDQLQQLLAARRRP